VLTAGARLAHYEITAAIGAGGMGEVYRATDTKLGRDVALKVLPAEMAGDPERLERFRREAKALAALDHPGIVTVHSVEQADGVHFLTMQLVEGQSLDTLIPEGGMGVEEIVGIASGLADALAAAHERGVIHRDLKPANVMVSGDGRVKVLDFGLAKVSGPGPEPGPTISHELTQRGAVMGTVPYMSPEQVSGRAVDQRTDIFSFGVMLYQMATGQRPFGGDTGAELSAAILRDTPESPVSIRSDLPEALQGVIERCLEKDPARRYQTAAGLRSDLLLVRREVSGPWATSGQAPSDRSQELERRGKDSAGSRQGVWIGVALAAVVAIAGIGYVALRGSTSESDRGAQLKAAPVATAKAPAHSIAVLPLVDMSQAKDEEYFSDGISEDLLNLLTKIPQLQVTARTSSFAFKGQNVAIPEIARRLHVAHVLEGSVQKAGNVVRITVQLVDAASDTQLWSQSWDRTLDDVFKIQDEIAGEVVKELKVKLLGAAPKARTTDPKAYALYLQAKELGRQKTVKAFANSDGLYRRVLAIDPRYVPAWVGLSGNVISEMGLGVMSGKEGYAAARATAEKALAVDPGYAPAHGELGKVALYQGDLVGAAREIGRALALDQTDLGVVGQGALLLQSLGRLDDALALDHVIVRRDPVNVSALFNLGTDQLWAGRLDAAMASFRTVLSLSPGRSGAHATIGEVLLLKGDAPAALAEIEQEPSEFWRMIGLPMAYHALGCKADSDQALAALITKYEKDGPYNIACVYAFRGEADKAFGWLDKAVEYGDPGLSEIVVENLFDKIRSDPRWLPFLRRLGKAPDQLAKIEFQVPLPATDTGSPTKLSVAVDRGSSRLGRPAPEIGTIGER
jgi:serine/threonine protein kinase/TolB-like protein